MENLLLDTTVVITPSLIRIHVLSKTYFEEYAGAITGLLWLFYWDLGVRLPKIIF